MMKKLILLLLVLPFLAWAQNDSVEVKKDSLNSSGTVPGLNIINTGNPTPQYQFVCRFPSSQQSTENPLFVIDGTVVDYDKTINEINPEEIGDIIVLKDVSATALYGSRGRNGVIFIRTKKYLEELEIQKNPYDLAVLDLGYESFLKMQPSAETYSLSYLQNKNKQYVSVWNSRVNTGNPEIYEMPIDYDSQTYYGLEFEYKLFQFFKFMEDKYKISMM